MLAVYARPYDPARPVVCMDENPSGYSVTSATRSPPGPGRNACQDSRYVRRGTCSIFVLAEPVADLIGRDFTAKRPDARLVGDITCLVTGQGRLFLATVIDLHNREVVGHALGADTTTDLVTEAIDLAAARGLISENAVFPLRP